MEKKHILIAVAAIMLVSCHSATLSFDEVEYITSSMTMPVRDVQTVDLGIKGIIDMKIRGPYMIVATSDNSGYIKVFDAESRTLLGSFFAQGNGPGELILPVTVSSMSFANTDGRWLASFNDNIGSFVRFDIGESVKQQKTVSQKYGSIPNGTFQALDLENDKYFFKTMSANRNAQKRYLVEHGREVIPPSFEILNKAELTPPPIDDGSYFNALSSIVRFEPEKAWFYEASTELNTIHVYSEDGSFARTYCMGDKLMDYNSVVKTEYKDRKRTFVSVDLFPEFYLALYQDSTIYDIDTGIAHDPEVLYLNIEEGVIGTIHLPFSATSIALDQSSGVLYAVNQMTEEVYACMVAE